MYDTPTNDSKYKLTKYLGVDMTITDEMLETVCISRLEKYNRYIKNDPYDHHLSYHMKRLDRLFTRYQKHK